MGVICVSIPPELELKIRQKAKKKGSTLSALVVEALDKYFEEEEVIKNERSV